MRGREVLREVGIVVVWLGVLAGLFAIDANSEALLLGGGAVATTLAGALIDRWWAVAVPAALCLLYAGIAHVIDPGCSRCTDETEGTLLVLVLVIVALPATVAMFIGVAGRRMARFFRRLDTEPDAEPG